MRPSVANGEEVGPLATEGLHRDLAGVALLDRMRIVGHVLGVAVGHLGDLRVDLRRVDDERRDGDRDRVVGGQLVVGLGGDRDLELEGLAALQARLGIDLGREGRDDARLVDGEGHERFLRLGRYDGVEIADAHALLGDLGDRLALLGTQVHLLGERQMRGVERLGDLFGGRDGVDDHFAAVGFLLGDLHLATSPVVRMHCVPL